MIPGPTWCRPRRSARSRSSSSNAWGLVLDLLLADLESGAYALDCGEADLGRARQLVKRYEDLSLGYVDAAVIACAERSGGRVLTFDLRDFGVVAAEGTITIAPHELARRLS
jgi:predicted nucleic acid-binding protein